MGECRRPHLKSPNHDFFVPLSPLLRHFLTLPTSRQGNGNPAPAAWAGTHSVQLPSREQLPPRTRLTLQVQRPARVLPGAWPLEEGTTKQVLCPPFTQFPAVGHSDAVLVQVFQTERHHLVVPADAKSMARTLQIPASWRLLAAIHRVLHSKMQWVMAKVILLGWWWPICVVLSQFSRPCSRVPCSLLVGASVVM